MSPARLPTSCDIFCKVVDNYGDIGVTWRLARQLNGEYAIPVRVVVDDLASFRMLAPGIDESRRKQIVGGIEVVAWREPLELATTAELVIEAFGCDLPSSYVASMARQRQSPVWINLEYLSAEAWIDTHHLLPSPHTVHALVKHFFFPGFTATSGGLLRERDAWNPPASSHAAQGGVNLSVFIFAYDNCPAEALLLAIKGQGRQVRVSTPAGALARKLKHCSALQAEKAPESPTVLDFRVLSFVPQAEFDGLLGEHDILFVRGEDSLVRALWAAKPFVWQIYPQAEAAHWRKLEAFLALYCQGLSQKTNAALRELWRAWNASDEASIGPAWRAFLPQLEELREHARHWSARQAELPDLASNLLSFYQKTAKI